MSGEEVLCYRTHDEGAPALGGLPPLAFDFIRFRRKLLMPWLLTCVTKWSPAFISRSAFNPSAKRAAIKFSEGEGRRAKGEGRRAKGEGRRAKEKRPMFWAPGAACLL